MAQLLRVSDHFQVRNYKMIMNHKYLIKKIRLTLGIILISLVSNAQHIDSVMKLPVFEVIESSLQNNLPVSKITASQIELLPVNDLGELLRRESNISGIRRGGYAVDPVIRGYRYSQINIFLDDGIHIEGGCPNRMDPVLSHIEPELIRQVEIVKGPYLLHFGPSPSASIRIRTWPEEMDYNRGLTAKSITGYDANRNGIKQHLSLSQSNERSFVRLTAGLKNYDNYSDGNGREWKTSYHKKDISADIGLKSGKSVLTGISYKGSFGRDVLFPALPMDEIEDNTHIFSGYLKHSNPAKPGQNFSASAYHSRVFHLMDNSFRPQYSQVVPPNTGIMQAVASVNTSTTGGRVAFSHAVSLIRFSHGADFRITQKDGTRNMLMIMEMDGQTFTSSRKFNLWKESQIKNSGLFTGAEWASGNFEVSSVVRLDLNQARSADTLVILKDDKKWFESKPVDQFLFSLALNSSWKINKNTSLIFGIARSQRSADMQERYIKFLATGFDRYDYLGNPGLKPETNFQADLMLKSRYKKIDFSLNLFRSQINNYISGTLVPPSVARPLSQGAPGVKQFNNIDKALFLGFETSADYTISPQTGISVTAGYTFAYFPEAERIKFENNQVSGTEIIKNDPIPEIPAFESSVSFSHHFVKARIKPVLSVRAVAAQNHVSLAAYEESTPGYLIADLFLLYTPFRQVSVAVGANNLFNHSYYDHLNRKLPGSSGKLFEPGRTFFINLKIEI